MVYTVYKLRALFSLILKPLMNYWYAVMRFMPSVRRATVNLISCQEICALKTYKDQNQKLGGVSSGETL